MRFWRLDAPKYGSDYKYSYVNGQLKYPFGLPGVKCDVCGNTSGGGGVRPYECPEALRSHKNLIDRWPIQRSEHALLQQQVFKALRMDGEPFVDLRPGDSFQPCYLDVPSRPRADFLWPHIGVLVVSERIGNLFGTLCGKDAVVSPIVLRKIGKREAKLPPPMPSTGEPEDLINEVPLFRDAATIGPYYQIIPLNESDYPRDRLPKSTCAGCRRVTVEAVYPWDAADRFRMSDDMWKGQKIFYLGSTSHIVVTDDIKERLVRMSPINVSILDAAEGMPQWP